MKKLYRIKILGSEDSQFIDRFLSESEYELIKEIALTSESVYDILDWCIPYIEIDEIDPNDK